MRIGHTVYDRTRPEVTGEIVRLNSQHVTVRYEGRNERIKRANVRRRGRSEPDVSPELRRLAESVGLTLKQALEALEE